MDERLSEFDDFFIIFMKMQSESGSRIGSIHQHRLFWREIFSCMPQKIPTELGIGFCLDQRWCCLSEYGHGVSKV